MITLPLTNSILKIIIDESDYEKLSVFKWRLKIDSKTKIEYACKSDGVKIHRFIMNAPKNMVVDHENRNGLDNRRKNLRICTHSQNMCNRKSYGSSKYLGVSISTIKYKDKKYIYWVAQISNEKKVKKIGYFKTEIEAAKAYDAEAKKYHGEFANFNFK